MDLSGTAMSADGHHPLLRHRTGVNPKGSALVGGELDLNEVDTPISSGAPEQPKGKGIHRLSVGCAAVCWRSRGKPSTDESGQEKRPNTLYQQVFASSCISLSCPSSPELIFEAHEHST
jgi:hypothetical protein